MNITSAARSGAGIALAGLLAGCSPSVSSMDCEKIAEEAVRIWTEAEDRPVRVTAIKNSKETARTDKEARCSGEGTLTDNSTTEVHMRAVEADNGSVIVESGDMPFPGEPAS